MSSVRIEIAGRVAFGNPSSLSLFFRSNTNSNDSTKTDGTTATNNSHDATEKLLAASSSSARGRDAAYEKMMAYGEEWPKEEELEEWSANNNTNSTSANTFEDNYHRIYQRHTQLAMTRLNKLKVEKKKKNKLYR